MLLSCQSRCADAGGFLRRNARVRIFNRRTPYSARPAGLFFACLVLSLLGPPARGGQQHGNKMEFLIARNEVRDPFFWHSVVLMLPATGNPLIVGLIINKPTRVALGKLFPENMAPENRTWLAYFGGPVDVNFPSVVFRSPMALKKTLHLYGNVYLTFDSDLVDASLEKPQPSSKVRVFLGRAQWSPERLKNEVMQGGWYRIEADGDLIFSSDPDNLWLTLHTEAAPGRYIKYAQPYGSRADTRQARVIAPSPPSPALRPDGCKLPFDFEADLQPHLKLLDYAVFYPAAFPSNFKPVHMPNGPCGFGNASLYSFSETYR